MFKTLLSRWFFFCHYDNGISFGFKQQDFRNGLFVWQRVTRLSCKASDHKDAENRVKSLQTSLNSLCQAFWCCLSLGKTRSLRMSLDQDLQPSWCSTSNPQNTWLSRSLHLGHFSPVLHDVHVAETDLIFFRFCILISNKSNFWKPFLHPFNSFFF